MPNNKKNTKKVKPKPIPFAVTLRDKLYKSKIGEVEADLRQNEMWICVETDTHTLQFFLDETGEIILDIKLFENIMKVVDQKLVFSTAK